MNEPRRENEAKVATFRQLFTRLAGLGKGDLVYVEQGTEAGQYLTATFGLGRAIAKDFDCMFIGERLLFLKDRRQGER